MVDKKKKIYNPAKNKYPKILIDIYNLLFYWPAVTLVRKPFGEILTAFSVQADSCLLKFLSSHKTFLFIIIKDKNSYRPGNKVNISAKEVIRATVPYYFLKQN